MISGPAGPGRRASSAGCRPRRTRPDFRWVSTLREPGEMISTASSTSAAATRVRPYLGNDDEVGRPDDGRITARTTTLEVLKMRPAARAAAHRSGQPAGTPPADALRRSRRRHQDAPCARNERSCPPAGPPHPPGSTTSRHRCRHPRSGSLRATGCAATPTVRRRPADCHRPNGGECRPAHGECVNRYRNQHCGTDSASWPRRAERRPVRAAGRPGAARRRLVPVGEGAK